MEGHEFRNPLHCAVSMASDQITRFIRMEMHGCGVENAVLVACESGRRPPLETGLDRCNLDVRNQSRRLVASSLIAAQHHHRHAEISGNQHPQPDLADSHVIENVFIHTKAHGMTEMAPVRVGHGMLADDHPGRKAAVHAERKRRRIRTAGEQPGARVQQMAFDGALAVPVHYQHLGGARLERAFNSRAHLERGQLTRMFVVPAVAVDVIPGIDDSGATLQVGHDMNLHRKPPTEPKN